ILANDPDADRFTIAEKQYNGEWIMFTGNQIGSMFAYNALENFRASGKSGKIAMLSSTVSSTMLSKMAQVEGFHWEDTLTGFKWIGNRAIELEKNEGYKVIFGYEEAIGFMLDDIVKDK